MDNKENTNNILDSMTIVQFSGLLPALMTEVLQKEFRGLTIEDGLILIWMILTDQEIAVGDIKVKTKSFISWNLGKIDARDGNFYLKKDITSKLKTKMLDYLSQNQNNK